MDTEKDTAGAGQRLYDRYKVVNKLIGIEIGIFQIQLSALQF